MRITLTAFTSNFHHEKCYEMRFWDERKYLFQGINCTWNHRTLTNNTLHRFFFKFLFQITLQHFSNFKPSLVGFFSRILGRNRDFFLFLNHNLLSRTSFTGIFRGILSRFLCKLLRVKGTPQNEFFFSLSDGQSENSLWIHSLQTGLQLNWRLPLFCSSLRVLINISTLLANGAQWRLLRWWKWRHGRRRGLCLNPNLGNIHKPPWSSYFNKP